MFTRNRNKSFTEIVLPKLGFCVGFIVVAFIMTHWLTAGQDNIINGMGDGSKPTQEQIMQGRENAPGSPAYVLEQHKADCWTSSDEPKADLPGAAIVQWTKNGMVQYTTVHWKVDAAFNEALAAIGFGDKTSDKLDVIALCK